MVTDLDLLGEDSLQTTAEAETPDAETPDTETPDTETPEAETPEAETPEAETPEAETPDAETLMLKPLMHSRIKLWRNPSPLPKPRHHLQARLHPRKRRSTKKSRQRDGSS